jgi:SAM-dependent methyltransferase
MREEVYDFIAENEKDHWWYQSRRVIFTSVLKRFLEHLPRDHKIYEMGCGGGGNFEVWSHFSDHCVGIDISDKALDSCRKFAYRDLILADASSVSKVPSNDASLVALCDVLEHVENDSEVLKEAHRILKPGGLLFITVPAFRFLWGGADKLSLHKRRYRRGQLHQRLQGVNFRVVRSTYFNTFLFPPILIARCLERLLRLRPHMEYRVLSQPLNNALKRIFGFERHLIRHMDLPFGVSVMVIAEKPLDRE